MNTDETRKVYDEIWLMDDEDWMSSRGAVEKDVNRLLNEIDRLRKRTIGLISEADRSKAEIDRLREGQKQDAEKLAKYIANIERRTKEAAKINMASKVRPVKDYPVFKEWVPYELALQAIEEAKGTKP